MRSTLCTGRPRAEVLRFLRRRAKGTTQGVDGPTGRPRGLQDPVDRLRSVLYHLAGCRSDSQGFRGRPAPLQGRDHRGRPGRCSAGFNRSVPGGICCSTPRLARLHQGIKYPTHDGFSKTQQDVVRVPMLWPGGGEALPPAAASPRLERPTG
eukprot:1097956-Amphidinium_carterae.2